MLVNKIHSAQSQYTSSLKKQDAHFRSISEQDMERIKQKYDDLQDAYKVQAYGYAFNIIGALLGIVAAGFDTNHTAAKALNGISTSLQAISGFKMKLDEGEIAKIQGTLELTRQSLQNGQKEDEELRQMLLQIERMLDEVQAQANRALSRAFNN